MEMRLHQLECLVAVADHGGVRRAAAALQRSPAAVSKALRELEVSIGAALTERHVDGLTTTEAGATLLAHARLVLGQLHRASEDLMNLTERKGGSVRMGVTPWLLHSVLPSTIREFRTLRPDVALTIHEHLGDEYPEVRNGNLDFAFGPQPETSQDQVLDSRRLFSYSFAVVGRLGHPAAGVRRLSDLRGYDWLLSRRVDHLSPALRELLGGTGKGARVVRYHSARSVHAALAVVRATDMLTLVPWPLIETPDMRDRFVTLHLDEAIQDSATCLVTRRYEPMQGAVIAFLDCFHRTARELAASSDPAMRRIFSMVEPC